ncbi:hypothetical protein NQ176_g6894 [Zarea fungicola]|uniref:Uncharacterized protein n=1 Tax=Zarea fungicola TaxID=93591 RepID=A0ACC1N1W7_9HYPO|nr:hypothetical protein NQ176_g6894 [Lecanicillium fungicola]
MRPRAATVPARRIKGSAVFHIRPAVPVAKHPRRPSKTIQPTNFAYDAVEALVTLRDDPPAYDTNIDGIILLPEATCTIVAEGESSAVSIADIEMPPSAFPIGATEID